MTEATQITDGDSLRAWLRDQPRAVAVAIAARAAARVLPLWWDWSRTGAARQAERACDVDLTALRVLRCCLIPSVAAVSPTDDIKLASAYAHAVDASAFSVNPDRAAAAAAHAATAHATSV